MFKQTLLLLTLIAVTALAENCAKSVACSAECAGYKAEKPRPRIYKSCLAGCQGGISGSCSACSNTPKPHPRTNKICAKACKSSGAQVRACERRNNAQKSVPAPAAAPPAEQVDRRLEETTATATATATSGRQWPITRTKMAGGYV